MSQATEPLATGKRGGKKVANKATQTPHPKGTVDAEGWTRVEGKKPSVPSYAAVAAQPAAPQSSPPQALTPLPGHATSTTTDYFWVQWIIPGIDDGKITADEVRRELQANPATKYIAPKASKFQFANRSLLSDKVLGGWYVAFQVPRANDPAGKTQRAAFHRLRTEGIRFKGRSIKPKKATRATVGTLCTVCCQFGHNAWNCFGRAPKCTLCAGKHWWPKHKCTFAECTTPEGVFCDTHEKLRCTMCANEHSAGAAGCKSRPTSGHSPKAAPSGSGSRAPSPISLW